MLHQIFKSTQITAIRLECSRSTIYSWLDGKMPSLKNMIQIKSTFKLDFDMQYFYTFFSLIQMMHIMEYEKFISFLHVSTINKQDKNFLKKLAQQKNIKKADNE